MKTRKTNLLAAVMCLACAAGAAAFALAGNWAVCSAFTGAAAVWSWQL